MSEQPRVALLVTCLIDLFRPSTGFACVKLLEDAGCLVEVPEQTCCGQPAYNSGDREGARAVARGLLDALAGYDHVVVPSGSCGGMLKKHLPGLFEDDPELHGKAMAIAERTHELVAFLVDVLGIERVDARLDGTITYHDACAGLRELGIRAQPRKLLGTVQGLRLIELEGRDVCCGFGGTFCVKYPEISGKMVGDKARAVDATGAGLVLAGDLGCLLNIAGRLKRDGSTVQARHVAEVLAGMTDFPAIGEGRG